MASLHHIIIPLNDIHRVRYFISNPDMGGGGSAGAVHRWKLFVVAMKLILILHTVSLLLCTATILSGMCAALSLD